MPSQPCRAARITATILALLCAAVFLVGAAMKLSAHPFEVQGFAHFGYEPWFMYAIGLAEGIGGLLLLLPRTAGVGALAMLAVMVGAIGSHLRADDPLGHMLPAFVVFALLLAVAWLRRRDLSALAPALRPAPLRG